MKLRSLFLVGVLCLAGSSFLPAKSRQFTIDKEVMCGNVQLPAGTYRVNVRNGKTEITNLNHFADKKPIALAATQQTADQKFDMTAVKVDESGNVPKVTEIDLSHTRTSLMFGE